MFEGFRLVGEAPEGVSAFDLRDFGDSYGRNSEILRETLQNAEGISFVGFHSLKYNPLGKCPKNRGHCNDGCRICAEEETDSLILVCPNNIPNNLEGYAFRYMGFTGDTELVPGGIVHFDRFAPVLMGEWHRSGKGHLFSHVDDSDSRKRVEPSVTKYSLFVLPGMENVFGASEALREGGYEEALKRGYLHEDIVNGGLFSSVATQVLRLEDFRNRVSSFARRTKI